MNIDIRWPGAYAAGLCVLIHNVCRLETGRIDFIIARQEYHGRILSIMAAGYLIPTTREKRTALSHPLERYSYLFVPARPSFTVNDANDDDLPFSNFLSRLFRPIRKLRYIKQSGSFSSREFISE